MCHHVNPNCELFDYHTNECVSCRRGFTPNGEKCVREWWFAKFVYYSYSFIYTIKIKFTYCLLFTQHFKGNWKPKLSYYVGEWMIIENERIFLQLVFFLFSVKSFITQIIYIWKSILLAWCCSWAYILQMLIQKLYFQFSNLCRKVLIFLLKKLQCR